MVLKKMYREEESQGGKWLTQVHLEEWPSNWHVCSLSDSVNIAMFYPT